MDPPCPSVSTAMVATKDESIPPESPITASAGAVLGQIVPGPEHQGGVDLGLGAQGLGELGGGTPGVWRGAGR